MASPASTAAPHWRGTLRAFLHPRVITMLFLGFSSGLPLLLIFSSLSLWLREVGVERSVVTLFSWAALGYSFKFVWAPLVDALPLPVLGAWLGRRRSWMLFSQLLVVAAIIGMALQDPGQEGHALVYMSVFAVMLGFSAATQDIVIDAYRIESAAPRLQALLSSSYIAGYRIGMLVAGAGVLLLASYYGSATDSYHYPAWRGAYLWMALAMSVGMGATLVIAEPSFGQSAPPARVGGESLALIRLFGLSVAGFVLVYGLSAGPSGALKLFFAPVLGGVLAALGVELLRLLLALGLSALIIKTLLQLGWAERAVVARSYVQPVKDFFERYGRTTAWLLLLLIGVYRISDIVLGVISNVFYQDLGFTKVEIATVSKSYGLFMSIAGGFVGGALAFRYGVLKILLLGALLAALTNLLFLALTAAGHNLSMLYLVISADNLSGGLASAAFVAFLSALTSIRFTAVQYAIFTSLMTLLPKALGGYSGAMVDTVGYDRFFVLTAVLGLPALGLIWLARTRLKIASAQGGDALAEGDASKHSGAQIPEGRQQ